MTKENFLQVQEQYRYEPVLFFFSIGTVNNTGDTIATEYTRDEMVRDCIAAIPLSQFAFEWNDGGFEAIPEISNSWVAVSPHADAKGGGIYNSCYEGRVQEIINKQKRQWNQESSKDTGICARRPSRYVLLAKTERRRKQTRAPSSKGTSM